MTFEIEVAGRARRVAVEPIGHASRDGGRFRIVLDGGSALIVDARRTGVGWSLCYEGDGRMVDAAVTEQLRNGLLVQLPHASLVATVDGRRRQRREGAAGNAGAGERIIAPMPGRVVRVLVAPGDQVAAGQGVVVVEAMKMENALTATHPGRVAEVAVAEGQSVEAGRLLVRLEK